MDLEKLAKEHIKTIILAKLYKRFQEFLDKDDNNSVVITLKPQGVVCFENRKDGKTEKEETVDIHNWIYEEQ